MMIIFLVGVQGVILEEARCRRVAEDVDLQEHLMCFASSFSLAGQLARNCLRFALYVLNH